ncbi:MAG: flagellar type III secretion system pore protein FliP [Eubacteriales bacterium]
MMTHKRRVKFSVLKGKIYVLLGMGLFWWLNFKQVIFANEGDTPPTIDINVNPGSNGEEVVNNLQMLFILTIIALAPSILIMMTSFTRIIVVLHFVRSALSTQQTPPNQVLVGLALFLTLFIMSPVINNVNEQALQPYSNGEIGQEEAIDKGLEPIREFMFKQVNDKDLSLFIKIGEIGEVNSIEDIPTRVLIPAFIISELRAAFIIGFLIYIPFIVIDMVIASTLMSMGMMMLPPVMISLPFKILLFILADGWNLVVGELVNSFY